MFGLRFSYYFSVHFVSPPDGFVTKEANGNRRKTPRRRGGGANYENSIRRAISRRTSNDTVRAPLTQYVIDRLAYTIPYGGKERYDYHNIINAVHRCVRTRSRFVRPSIIRYARADVKYSDTCPGPRRPRKSHANAVVPPKTRRFIPGTRCPATTFVLFHFPHDHTAFVFVRSCLRVGFRAAKTGQRSRATNVHRRESVVVRVGTWTGNRKKQRLLIISYFPVLSTTLSIMHITVPRVFGSSGVGPLLVESYSRVALPNWALVVHYAELGRTRCDERVRVYCNFSRSLQFVKIY